jgi:hypothetical protein
MKRLGLLLALLLCASSLQAQCLLRQSTAGQEISLGPFLLSTDGDTAQTALSIANTDIRVKKGAANWASKNSGGATHEENGNYFTTVDNIDSSAVGILEFFIHKAGALAVWKTCFVLEANEYDSLVGAAVKSANLTQWLGGTPGALVSGRPDVSVGAVATNGIDAGGLSAAAVTKIQTGLYVIQKGVAFNNYEFKLRNADGTAYTAGTFSNVVCKRLLDGGTLSACAATTQASIIHKGNGTYIMNISAADMTANSMWLRVEGPNCASTANNCWEAYITPQH